VRRDPEDLWDAARFERALSPYLDEYGEIDFTPRARLAEYTHIRAAGPDRFEASQTLLDPKDDGFWCIEAEVALSGEIEPNEPFLRLSRIGT
jgi:hypothetical protein